MTEAKQITRGIKLAELLGYELKDDYKKVKNFINDKIEGLIKFENDNYPDIFFYKKDDVVLFKIDLKRMVLYCSYTNYWIFFRDIILLRDKTIRELTMIILETYLGYEKNTFNNIGKFYAEPKF